MTNSQWNKMNDRVIQYDLFDFLIFTENSRNPLKRSKIFFFMPRKIIKKNMIIRIRKKLKNWNKNRSFHSFFFFKIFNVRILIDYSLIESISTQSSAWSRNCNEIREKCLDQTWIRLNSISCEAQASGTTFVSFILSEWFFFVSKNKYKF